MFLLKLLVLFKLGLVHILKALALGVVVILLCFLYLFAI